MPIIHLAKRERVSALIAGLDYCGEYARRGTDYEFSWHPDSTQSIIKRIKEYTPENARCSIPYLTLLSKINVAHRTERSEKLANV